MIKEQELYEKVAALNEGDHYKFGIHQSAFVDCEFPSKAYGYRVYHSDGYCFDIIWERQWDEDGKEMEPHYEFIEGIFDGFKSLTLEQAIELI